MKYIELAKKTHFGVVKREMRRKCGHKPHKEIRPVLQKPLLCCCNVKTRDEEVVDNRWQLKH